MASNEGKSQSDFAGVVKWIVLGVITITVLFLFKGEISRFLNKAETVKIGALEIKTAQTVLGTASVSNETVKASTVIGDGIQGSTYVNRNSKFQITWPEGNGWNASETMGKSLIQQLGFPPTVDMPLVIMKNEMVGNFRPNVNVVVETIGGMTASDYINRTVQALQQLGWQVLTKDIDEATQGGFISTYYTTSTFKLYQFQRIVVANGKGYVITASQLPPEDSLSQQLKAELLSILNSFRIIV
jgi:hypothetical protein